MCTKVDNNRFARPINKDIIFTVENGNYQLINWVQQSFVKSLRQRFYGQCYHCGGWFHCRKVCPLQQCLTCKEFGHLTEHCKHKFIYSKD